MKKIFSIIFILFSATVMAQNVGVGETNPTEAKLQVKSADSAVLILQNTAATLNSKTALFYKGDNYYSGGIGTIQTGFGFYRMGLFTYGSIGPSGLLERMSILDDGNVGIGTITPTAKLEVNGLLKLTGGSPGAGKFLKSDNTGLASWYDLSPQILPAGTAGQTARNNGSGWLATSNLYNDGSKIGIGNTSPTSPLSFSNSLGKKISLYPGVSGDAGFGVFGNELRINTDYNGADITFGYDNFTNGFTENMRLKGNGNVGVGTNAPNYKLDVNGRIRLRHNGVTPGIWFNNSTNTEASFIGQYTDNLFGIFGNAWQFAVNRNDGTVYMGSSNLDNENLTNGAGYKLKVFGKVIAEEVRVQLKNAWPDYVFESGYKKLSITDLEKFVIENKHLPNIPSAKEIEQDGHQLGDVQVKMLEKIEELSLYIIELNKKVKALEEKISSSENKK